MYYEINESLAKQAKQMRSFDDYKENSATNEYRNHIISIEKLAEKFKEKAKYEETKDKIDYCVARYSKKYADWINEGNKINCMCPSWMITGRSNYPIKKFNKQQELYSKHMKEYEQFEDIEYKLRSILSSENIIKSGDKNAVEKLEEKILKKENLQNEMKEQNAYYRKYKSMKGYKNLSDEEAAKIDEEIKKDRCMGNVPNPSYMLSNNNQEIRRLKNRLEAIKKAKKAPTQEIKNEYFKIVRNSELMRLQLFFDGKPSEEVRKILKDNGFKFSYKNEAWQRHLNANSEYAVKRVLKELEQKENK